MLTVIMTVLDVLVLGVLVMDYLKTNEYLEEQERMKGELRKMHYELCEMEDQLRAYMHG